MNVDFALSKLKKLAMGDNILRYPSRNMPLHSLVSCCGWQRRLRGCHYDWNGEKRGSAEFALIQYTLRGRGMLDFEGVRKEVLPGMVMILHFPHRNRYWLPDDSEEWEFLYACLNGRDLMRIWRELVSSLGPLFELDSESETIKTLLSIYERTMEPHHKNPFENSGMAYFLTMSLAALTMNSEQEDDSMPEGIRKALRLCHSRLGDPALNVEMLAAETGLSRHHFSRVFERCVGETPAAHIKGYRMKEAARLLQSSSLSVKEVASACGFADCSYFCQAFKLSFGLPPFAFRKGGITRQSEDKKPRQRSN